MLDIGHGDALTPYMFMLAFSRSRSALVAPIVVGHSGHLTPSMPSTAATKVSVLVVFVVILHLFSFRRDLVDGLCVHGFDG